MRQRKSLELYPLTMCYFIKRTQKCTKLFFKSLLNQLDEEVSDDITKILNDFKVWPVVKLSFRGRIL